MLRASSHLCQRYFSGSNRRGSDVMRPHRSAFRGQQWCGLSYLNHRSANVASYSRHLCFRGELVVQTLFTWTNPVHVYAFSGFITALSVFVEIKIDPPCSFVTWWRTHGETLWTGTTANTHTHTPNLLLRQTHIHKNKTESKLVEPWTDASLNE